MTRIIINGALGKMGSLACQTLEQNNAFKVVAKTTKTDNLAKIIKQQKADIVVDLTHPKAVYQNTKTIIQNGARPIIGTTGLTPTQIKKLQDQCKKLKRGGIIAPNFSIGMVLMIKYAKEFAKYFPHVEIIEMHHAGKKDSPSGTALFTAESLNVKNKTSKTKSHEMIPGSRGAHYLGVPIHAIRLPGLLAHEQILFGDIGETLTLRHDTSDRQCFMRGLTIACEKVMKLKRLVYGLGEVL